MPHHISRRSFLATSSAAMLSPIVMKAGFATAATGNDTARTSERIEGLMAKKWQVFDGFPCGNFSFAANVSRQGRIGEAIIRNPGQLRKWLEPLAATSLCVSTSTGFVPFDQLDDVQVERRWPFARVSGKHPDNPNLSIKATAFIPAAIDDEHATNLPCLLVDLQVENRGKTAANVEFSWEIDSVYEGAEPVPAEATANVAVCGPIAIGVEGGAKIRKSEKGLTAQLSVPAGESRPLRWAFAAYDPHGGAARQFQDQVDIARYALRNSGYLMRRTSELEQALPRTGVSEVDEALRWYMGAGVYLTRCARSGAVLTMGYEDLNQRDSYWTSWPHLVLWPSLERRMIEESAASLDGANKVPTCILSVIERPDDLDINAYFILRTIRYAAYHDDMRFAYRLWPAVLKALDWLVARSPQGLPIQGTYWGDWKDVAGVEDRKHSPHACLLYIAALDRAIKLGRRIQKNDDCDRLESELAKAMMAINKDTAHGGLWNGQYYVQAWDDGRKDDKILLDQCVGLVFGVVAKERADSILDALQQNRCPLGIRETWPYYPASFGYDPGTYHNGGVWPWLSFAGAWAHFRAGRREEGLAIIKDVAQADLVAQGDYQPNEYVHAETGENRGPSFQGWDACLFGALYFGLVGKETP